MQTQNEYTASTPSPVRAGRHQRDKFFVMEKKLGDGSAVYDIYKYLNSPSEPDATAYVVHACNETRAFEVRDALNSLFKYVTGETETSPYIK